MTSTIIFDLDGTLLNTTEYVYQAFEYAFGKYFKQVSREKISSVVGKPLVECIQILTGRDDIISQCASAHKEFQKNHPELSKLYPHVFETLKHLHNQKVKLAVLTSRSRDSVMETMGQEQIVPFFSHILTIEDVKFHKPHPEGIQKILKNFNVSPQEALMVGDSDVDIQAGLAAGVGTIGATYGFHGENIRESNPDHVITSIEKLLDILPMYR